MTEFIHPCLWSTLCLLFASKAPPTPGTGTEHKSLALIVCDRLASAAKQRVDQILAEHPGYPSWIASIPIAER